MARGPAYLSGDGVRAVDGKREGLQCGRDAATAANVDGSVGGCRVTHREVKLVW